MKKVSLLLVLSMVLSLSVPVFGEPIAPTKPGILISPRPSTGSVELVGFRDVPENHWAYASIMEMTDMGIFSGVTSPDGNGIADFAPDKTMTRAEFITILGRHLSDNYFDDKENDTGYWYGLYWKYFIDLGILYDDAELGGIEGMKEPITREEMAMLTIRGLEAIGEFPNFIVPETDIPDLNKVSEDNIPYVLSSYSLGILTGVDNQGTFNPKGVLTRAQGAAVMYRIINEDARIVPTLKGKDIPALNLDLSVPKNADNTCGSDEWLNIMTNPSEADTIILTPLNVYETTNFNYNGQHYEASEGKYYFIMDVVVKNKNIQKLDMSNVNFSVGPYIFSKHDVFTKNSTLTVFNKYDASIGESFYGFLVFEIPDTISFIEEGDFSFHAKGKNSYEKNSSWSSGGTLELYN